MKRIITILSICLASFASANAQELANFNFGGRMAPSAVLLIFVVAALSA